MGSVSKGNGVAEEAADKATSRKADGFTGSGNEHAKR